jgi:hypothetical protein
MRMDGAPHRPVPLPDPVGEFPGVVLVPGAGDQELPPPDDREPLAAELARQRDRLAVRREFGRVPGPQRPGAALRVIDDVGGEHRRLAVVLPSNHRYRLDHLRARALRRPVRSAGQ